jgi:hypothetical protein
MSSGQPWDVGEAAPARRVRGITGIGGQDCMGASIHPTGSGVEERPLPLSATANDVRVLAQYLRKRPGGVTLGEAVDTIKRQIFEPAKITAYESLGLVERSGDRLKLGALGWGLARALEPEVRLFRALLERVGPYRAALEMAHRQSLDCLLHGDVASFWLDHHPEALGIYTPKMIESSVVCFFQMCQAAGLGTYIFGKRGQPTRLRLNREEVIAFLSDDFITEPADGPAPVPPEPADGATRVFVSFGHEAAATASHVQAALKLADIEGVLSERGARARLLLLPSGEAMCRCRAAVFIVTAADAQQGGRSEDGGLAEILRAEVAAAHLLYQGRLALLWDAQLPVPEELEAFAPCAYGGGDLTWEEGVRLTLAIKALTRNP